MNDLQIAKITSITEFSFGRRVLLDFMTTMDKDDYVLVGNTLEGFLALVSENHQSENYYPRTFRFNVGALHQYIKVGEEKVRYIEELISGDSVIVGINEKENELTVGRVKHEMRPFLKIEVECKGSKISAILQKGETIALLTPSGCKHLSTLKEGDEVMCQLFGQATHLGEIKDEFVYEA